MRIFFLLLLFAFAQLPSFLVGDYTDTYHGMIGASWHFEKDGTFTYSEANCEGGRVGKGTYKIDGDSVHFVFERSETSNIASKLEAKRLNGASGWTLYFELKDRKNNEEVIFAHIVVKDRKGNILQQAASSISGDAMVKIPGYNDMVSITVQSLGYSNAELKLETPGSYSIKGVMSQNFGPAGIREGTRYDYKLLSVGKKSMQWQTTKMHPDTTITIELKKSKRR